MQTSGMCPQFSDGVKKAVQKPVRVAVTPKAPAPTANTHRAGGHAKHAKGAR